VQKQWLNQPSITRAIVRGSYLLVLAAMLAVPVFQTASAAKFTKPQLDAVREITNYFNSIRSMKGVFTQIGPRGRVSNGIFYIVKPGRMRFEYAAPNPFLVVSDGSWVYVKNRTRKRVDHYPLTATPLRLILDKKVNFSKETKIQSIDETSELTTVTLKDTSSFASGSLVLVFDKASQTLQQWIVVDERGRRTTVSISDIEKGVKPDPKLFKVKLPKSEFKNDSDRN